MILLDSEHHAVYIIILILSLLKSVENHWQLQGVQQHRNPPNGEILDWHTGL